MRLIILVLLTAAILEPQIANAQAPAETTPASGVTNKPAVIDNIPHPRVAQIKTVPGKRADFEGMVAAHAKANDVPESLVHRIIVRESKYQAHLVSRGNIGLMQIKLATARGLGYTGTAEGLRDANTNMTYGVKYLAGAWRTADGNADRAVSYYARGYYYAAKAKGLYKSIAATAGEALQVVALKIRSVKDRGRKAASAGPAPPRLDELTRADAPVGSTE